MVNADYLASKKKGLTRLIIVVSILIPIVVGVLLFITPPQITSSINLHYLPAFHAVLNTINTILLILAFIFIRQKKIVAHKTSMLFALLCSVLFLVSYVTYHSLTEPTTYGGEGVMKYIYYFILITHIILAAVIVPLVLFSFLFALTNQFKKHKKIVKWTWPLWLYVSITGVLVYLMISPYYG